MGACLHPTFPRLGIIVGGSSATQQEAEKERNNNSDSIGGDALEQGQPHWRNGGKGGVVHVWHSLHWASWMFEVDNIAQGSSNNQSGTIHFGRGGFQGAR